MKFFSANRILISVLLAAVIVLAGCLGGQPEAAENGGEEGTQTPTGALHEISIQGNAYSATSLTIGAGDSVKWTNLDDRIHQVQILDITSSPVLLKDGTWTYAFRERGTYAFRDADLPFMSGTITVQ